LKAPILCSRYTKIDNDFIILIDFNHVILKTFKLLLCYYRSDEIRSFPASKIARKKTRTV